MTKQIITPLATVLLAFLSLTQPAPTFADETVITPTGEYATIDVALTNSTIKSLRAGNLSQRKQAVEEILAQPDHYAPPVFYALSAELLKQGKKDDAAFWFYAGQLRARYDANRCADLSAREAVAVLNQEYGGPINQYTFSHLPMLEALIPKVVDWDRKTAHNYDHRWINLHGMGAVMSGLETDKPATAPSALSLPKEKWNEIAVKTREDYLQGFHEALKQAKQ